MDVLMDGVVLAVIGILVVFVALALVALVVSNLKHVDRWAGRAFNHQHAAPPPQTSTLTSAPADTLPPELVAVISAAVAVAIDKRVKIKRIRYRRRPAPTWQTQGRATIMASHVVKK